MTDSTVAVTPHPPPASRHGRRWRIAGTILAVVVLGVLAVGAWWFTHPTWFPSSAAEESAVTAPGRPLWTAVTFPNVAQTPITLQLDAVVAHVVSDTSAATVTPYVCTNRPGLGRGVVALGTGGTAMMRQLCMRVVRADDVGMTVGRDHPEYLILKIVPAHAGRLRLDRVDVTYQKGLQRGTQGIALQLTVTARPAG
jgi:hypothetical protein